MRRKRPEDEVDFIKVCENKCDEFKMDDLVNEISIVSLKMQKIVLTQLSIKQNVNEQ